MSDIEDSEISSTSTAPFNPEETKLIKKFLTQKEGWKKYGRIRVYCNEAIFIGPVRSWWWCLLAFTIFVFILAQFEYFPAHYYLMIASSLVILVYLVATLKTCICDPGIWPRPSFDEAYANAIDLVVKKQRAITYFFNHTKFKTIHGKVVIYTYCHRCNHFRPPKTGHCATCDVCIEDWDHHCPVYGGCVGKKNYIFFLTMVLTTITIHLLLPISCIILAANRDHIEGFFGFMKSSLVVSAYVVAIPMVCILPLILRATPCERNKDGVSSKELYSDVKYSAADREPVPSPKVKREKEKPKSMTSEIPLTIPLTPSQNHPNPNLKKSQFIPNLNNELVVVQQVAVQVEVEVDVEDIKINPDTLNANDDKDKKNEIGKAINKLNNITYSGDTWAEIFDFSQDEKIKPDENTRPKRNVKVPQNPIARISQASHSIKKIKVDAISRKTAMKRPKRV